jgi:hypothetical protein
MVHRTCCRTLTGALSRRRRRRLPDSTVSVDWRAILPLTYLMAVTVQGQDHAGLMHQLARCAELQGINLAGSYARALQERNKALVMLICAFTPEDEPAVFLSRLRTIPGITVVRRDTALGCADPGDAR